MISRTLNHYLIQETLGGGGMGIVYLARDTRLDRPVAIKVLPAVALSNPENKKRFVQEAKAASALNHPNIVTIYDIDTADGVDFIAMEYVSGSTLHNLIGGKGLPVADVLRYAVQIADALAAAHAAGIVHRDLKPANIMVTGKGLVKVVDFGLAKLVDPAAQSESDVTRTMHAPAPLTEGGFAVGTAAYMSPEQAQGLSVDGRSDIFSFGAVLYEMLTGRRAFDRGNNVATLSAVLLQQPAPINEILTDVPYELERIVARCLRKDPASRFQHVDDLKVALKELQEEAATGTVPMLRSATFSPRRRRFARAGIAVGLLAVAGLGGWWWRETRKPAPLQTSLTRLTSDGGLTTDPAISADGKLIAFASDRAGSGNLDIWMRQTAGGEPVQLTSDPADESAPSFAPDGVHIAFRSEKDGGGVYVIPTLGGAARLAAKSGRDPRYSPDGKLIAYWVGERQSTSTLGVVPAAGGEPRQLRFEPPFYSTRSPLWSADGKHLLFLGRDNHKQEYDWWVGSLDTGKAVRTGAFDVFRRQGLPVSYVLAPADWVAGKIYFSTRITDQRFNRTAHQNDIGVIYDSTNLWQVPIEPDTWRIKTPATRLTFGTSAEAQPAATAQGQLVFASLIESINVWSIPTTGSAADRAGKLARLTDDTAGDTYPTVSGDGKFLVYASQRSGNSDIWLKDLEKGRQIRLTTDPVFETFPMIASGRSNVAYAALEENSRSIRVVHLEPGGQPGASQTVCQHCGYLSDISADGESILYYDNPPKGITLQNIATHQTTQILTDKMFLADPRFSPDARWVAFHSITGDTKRRVFVAPLRPGATTPQSEWIPITDGMGMEREPAWSADGNMLYFLTERDGFRCIAAQALDPQSKKPTGPMLEVAHFHSARRSLMGFLNAAMARMSVSSYSVVFSLTERTGNIWLATQGAK